MSYVSLRSLRRGVIRICWITKVAPRVVLVLRKHKILFVFSRDEFFISINEVTL